MDQYHQILCLTLKETGKNKVLEAVKALEARPDVLSAEPDYLVAVEENPDDSYYSSEQWGPQKINLADAWDYVTGTSTFCVGVLCAISNYPGLVVCSAGNDSRDNDIIPHYPSQFTNQLDNVISVGASTELDEIADFSNYGETTVDIFAPGDDILSCFPYARCSSTNCTVAGHFAYGYHSLKGTSMATPYVTGVAALMLAENPNLTPAAIKDTINEKAKQMDAFDGKCVSNGRLDALEAIKEVHIHRYNYTTTATTHTGSCRCGSTTVTQRHMLVTDAYGTQICRVCGYSIIGQID